MENENTQNAKKARQSHKSAETAEKTVKTACENAETAQKIKECEDAIAAINQELEKERNRADDMTIQCQRLQAEFDNYRKRTNETNKRVRIDGVTEVLEKLLPVLDAIDQAKKLITDEKVLEGLSIISRQTDDLLSGYGVKQIEALGQIFDPTFHNAVFEKEVGESDKDKVVEVYQQGYTMGDRVIRHSVVVVGK